MQEKKVTAGGEDYPLGRAVLRAGDAEPHRAGRDVSAAGGPARPVLFNILVDYPSWEEEIEIVNRVSGTMETQLEHVLGREEILSLQALVRRIPVAAHMVQYATRLARATRPEDEEALDFTKEYLTWGAGPRASLYMIIAAKARAALRGRFHVAIEDIQAVAKPVLRHRLILNFSAQSEGMTPDAVHRKTAGCHTCRRASLP